MVTGIEIGPGYCVLVRARLRDEYGIEIGAGLGPLKGKVWRIGLMGHGSQKANVLLLLAALVDLLRRP